MGRIVVTRPAGREAELVRRLEELGHQVEHVPLIAIEPLPGPAIEVECFDWVVLTSVTAATLLRERMSGIPRRVAAIGRATADAFGGADLVADVATQEGLLGAMPSDPGRVLFAAAEGARPLLPAKLDAEIVVLYRTRELAVPALAADLVVLASPSAARAFGRSHSNVPAVTIGPETTRAATETGVRVGAEAPTHDLDGLVVAVRAVLGDVDRSP